MLVVLIKTLTHQFILNPLSLGVIGFYNSWSY